MKSEDLNNIKALLTRYEDGKTSLEEEQRLMAFFNAKDVPQELVDYQLQFNYFAAFRDVHFTGSLDDLPNYPKESIFKKIVQFLSKWWTMLLLVVLPALLFFVFQHQKHAENVTTTQIQEHTNPSTLVTTDSTTAEKAIAKSDPTTEPESIPSSTTDNPPMQQKETPASANLPSIQIAPTKVDGLSPQKKDTTIGSAPGITKTQITAATSIEGSHSDTDLNSSTGYTKSPPPAREKVVFNLTEKTRTGELAAIARKADKAGIEYTYVVDQHKKKTHELNIVMVIRRTGERSQLWISVPKKSSFQETLFWTIDNNGQAVSLCPVRIEHKAKARHPIE